MTHSLLAISCLKSTKKCTLPTRPRSTECLFVVFFFQCDCKSKHTETKKINARTETNTQCAAQNHTVSTGEKRSYVCTFFFCNSRGKLKYKSIRFFSVAHKNAWNKKSMIPLALHLVKPRKSRIYVIRFLKVWRSLEFSSFFWYMYGLLSKQMWPAKSCAYAQLFLDNLKWFSELNKVRNSWEREN